MHPDMSRAIPLLVQATAATLALSLTSGCLVTDGAGQPSATELALQQDLMALQEENRRLKGQLEGMELEIDRLARAVDALRAAPAGPSTADIQALQQRMGALEAQLRNIDAARERDRKEIIDTLTARISQLLASQTATRPRTASAPTPSAVRRGGAQEGYEHVVEAGQSLSAIAAAYGVSVREIVEANNLSNPNSLRVGQKLFIPAKP